MLNNLIVSLLKQNNNTMSFAITLPDQIVAKVVNMGNITPDAELTNLVKDKINDYVREIAMVAIILSDNYMKQLYLKSNMGYMNCIDTLHQWAVEYITKFAHVTEWDEFLDTDRTFGHCSCWDDHCMAFGKAKLDNL